MVRRRSAHAEEALSRVDRLEREQELQASVAAATEGREPFLDRQLTWFAEALEA